MGKKYNWGILGAGKMAAKFSKGIRLHENACLYSVGSRDITRAKKFAEDNGYKKFYGSYEEFTSDPDLDIVYIATPHSSHYENTMLCLEKGRHVICEKAFSLNAPEVKEMIKTAAGKNLFLMEALWPPFQPFYAKAKEILATGVMGEIIHTDAWFSFQPPYDPLDRKFNVAMGGGSLLDIGIYPVIDVLTFMGVPDEISAMASFAPTGSEKTLCVIFRYSDGRMATIYSSFTTTTGIGCQLHCSKGNLTVSRGRDMNQRVIMELTGKEKEEFVFRPDAMGYHYEAEEVMRCLDEGRTESDVVPLSFSLKLIETLDRIRHAAGIVFPGRD
ncbi:MAG: Gfo/Idh/MocA family oxidoreductase [Bacteroidales bacterium]|jgi:predicted dehydrogenase